MKKILNFLKALLYGILPAIAGGCITLNVYYIINNIQRIASGSGWEVVLYFALGATELFLGLTLLYELGSDRIRAKNWIKYKREQSENNIASSPSDCETSDEATNV